MTHAEGARPGPGMEPARPTEAELGELLAAARAVATRAYSPYSGLRVGAALLDREDAVHVGCNVENASYGLTVCAERVALGCAVSAGARAFRAVAIVSSRAEPLPPCGACRQVLHELAPNLWVVSEGSSGERVLWRLAELLPAAFGPDPARARSADPAS